MAIDKENRGIFLLEDLIAEINKLGANEETKRKVAQNGSRIKNVTFQVSLENMIKKGKGKVFFQTNPEHSYIFTTDSIYLRDDTSVGIDNGKLVFDPDNVEFATGFIAGLLERLSYRGVGNIGKIGFTRSYQKNDNNINQDQSNFDHLMALYLAEKVTGHESTRLVGCQRAFLNCLEEVFGVEPILNSFLLNGSVEPNLRNMFDNLLQMTNPSAYDFMTTKLSETLSDPKEISTMTELIQETRNKLIVASVANQAFESKKIIDQMKKNKQDVTKKIEEMSQSIANYAEKYSDIPDFEQRVDEKIEELDLENERKKREYIEKFRTAGEKKAHQFATGKDEQKPKESSTETRENESVHTNDPVPESPAPKKESTEEKPFSPPPLSQEEKVRKLLDAVKDVGVRAVESDLGQIENYKREEEPTVSSPLKENFIVNDITGAIIDQRNATFADRLRNFIVATGKVEDVVNDSLVKEKCANSSQAYLKSLTQDETRVNYLKSILGDDWMNEIRKAYEEGWKTGMSMAVESIKEDSLKERNELASGKISQEINRSVGLDELAFAEKHFGFADDGNGNQVVINLTTKTPVQSARTQKIMNALRDINMKTSQIDSNSDYGGNPPKAK